MPVNVKPNFKSFIRLAPNITGTAKKKLNSAPVTRETPRIIAPKMVEPLREVPGIKESA